MNTTDWKLVDVEPPPMNKDVLIWSTESQGYAVAVNTVTGIRNAITGQLFGPAITHWCLLPNPPVTKSGFSHSHLAIAQK